MGHGQGKPARPTRDSARLSRGRGRSRTSRLDRAGRARVLALVLDEVVVDGATGEAELLFRGAL